MRRVTTLVSAILAGAIVLTGCGGSSGGDSTTTPKASGSSSAAASDLKVGMAYDIGGRGDQSFNDSAAAGLDKAKADLGIQTKEAEASAGEADSAKEERLRVLADLRLQPGDRRRLRLLRRRGQGRQGVPGHQVRHHRRRGRVGDNIANLVFAEEQGSYLVGYAAGLKTKTNNVGFIGGVDVPLIHKFEAGYEAGAKAANPKIKVQVKYLTQPPDFTGFNDPAKGKTAAQGMYDAGADIIYAAAGGSGCGVFEAAQGRRATRPSVSTPTSTRRPTRRSRTSS